jgi:hypothetical protein
MTGRRAENAKAPGDEFMSPDTHGQQADEQNTIHQGNQQDR